MDAMGILPGESLGIPEQPGPAAQPAAAPPAQGGGTGSLLKTALSGFILGAVQGMGAKNTGESAARGSQAVMQQQQQQQEQQNEQQKAEQNKQAAADQRRMQVANYNLNVYKSQIDRDRLDFDQRKEANDQSSKSAQFFMDALKDNPNSFVIKDDASDALHSETVLNAMKAKGLSPDTAFVYHDPTTDQTLVMSAKHAETVPLGDKASQLQAMYAPTIQKYFPALKGQVFTPDMKMADATLLMDRMNQLVGKEQAGQKIQVNVGSPESIESQAQDLYAGRLAPSQLSKKSASYNSILNRASEIAKQQGEQGFNAKQAESNFQSGKAIDKAFTSGDPAKNITAFNTASGHLQQLGDLVDALGNGRMQVFNKLGNEFAKQTGSAAPTNFDTVRNAAVSEVGKLFSGGVVAQQELEEIKAPLMNANSPTQLKQAVSQLRHLMESRKEALKNQYQQGKEGKPAFETSEGAKTFDWNAHPVAQ